MAENRIAVSYDQLNHEVLRKLIEEFISRDGTFYGKVELALDEKVDLVIDQLKTGEAVIVWDLVAESGNIVKKEEFKKN